MKLGNRKLKGFTLVEFLMVIAIIALLTSIMMPTLQKAGELARSVVCKSNLSGMGVVFVTYANDYDGRIPPTGLNDRQAHSCMNSGYVNNSWWPNVLVDGEYVEVGPIWPGTWGNWAWGDYWGSNAGIMQCPITRTRSDVPNETFTSNYGYPCFEFNAPHPWPSPGVNSDYKLCRTSRSAERFLLIDGGARVIWSNARAGNLIPSSGYVSTRHFNDSANVLFMDGHAATFHEDDILDPANDWYGVVNE